MSTKRRNGRRAKRVPQTAIISQAAKKAEKQGNSVLSLHALLYGKVPAK
jgi:hypothetical protein